MLKKLFLVLTIILCIVTVGFASEGTKTFKFLDYGTYTVPEDFPENFFNFPGNPLIVDELAEGRGIIVVVEHEFSGSPGTTLFMTVAAYGDKKIGFCLLYAMTITAVDGVDPSKWVICEYYDKKLFETGEPSKNLIKVDEKLDFAKFRAQRVFALSAVET